MRFRLIVQREMVIGKDKTMTYLGDADGYKSLAKESQPHRIVFSEENRIMKKKIQYIHLSQR